MVILYVAHTKHLAWSLGVIPAVLRSMCSYRWHPCNPSATGFPPGKLCHHHSTLNHLCGHTYTWIHLPNLHAFLWESQNVSLGLKRPYVVHTWTLLCYFPNKCNSSSDHFHRGGPTSLQRDSCCHCRGTTLMMDKIKVRETMGDVKIEFQICQCAPGKQISHKLTGWVTSEVATAQAQAPAPQLEACLRHPLPFTTNIVVGCSKGIITWILSGGHFLWDWGKMVGGKNVSHLLLEN